jgi:hypothetical protein
VKTGAEVIQLSETGEGARYTGGFQLIRELGKMGVIVSKNNEGDTTAPFPLSARAGLVIAINGEIFKRHFWGELLRRQHQGRSPPLELRPSSLVWWTARPATSLQVWGCGLLFGTAQHRSRKAARWSDPIRTTPRYASAISQRGRFAPRVAVLLSSGGE